MAKYLFQGAYVGDGLKGLMADGGTSRIEAARALFGSLGGSLDSFYFTVDRGGLVVICDLPDNVSAAALTLALNATGVVTGEVVPLLTPDEVDRAVRMTPAYRAPGQHA